MFGIELSHLIFRIPAAFFALALHEMVKASCSAMQGDPTPERHGLLRCNPIKRLEPIGFIITVIFGFGWGRPTPTSPLYYQDRKKGILITNVTPSLVNFSIGLLVALFVGILNIAEVQAVLNTSPQISFIASGFFTFLTVFAHCSVNIAIFNMIPIPPMDAAKILQLYVSPNTAVKLAQNERLLQLVLMMLILMGIVTAIILPITNTLVNAAWHW